MGEGIAGRSIEEEPLKNIVRDLNEGVPVEHVQVFDEALRKQGSTKVIPVHPVHTYRMENRELRKRFRVLKNLAFMEEKILFPVAVQLIPPEVQRDLVREVGVYGRLSVPVAISSR